MNPRPRATRRLMVRDVVTSPWGDVGTVVGVARREVEVQWSRSPEPETIDRELVRIRPRGRPRKAAAA